MAVKDPEEILAQRFRITKPPALWVPSLVKQPITFSHLRSTQALSARSLNIPGEEAFAFQVPLSGPFFSTVWNCKQRTTLPSADQGSVFLFDLAAMPVVELDTPFNTLRMYISQHALDQMAYERGHKRVGGLRATGYGDKDFVLHGLAQMLAAAMAQPETASQLFTEHITLAFHDHIIRHYGNAPKSQAPPRGGLAPWQLRRAHEFINQHLGRDISITELAIETGYSASHFSRAFKQTVGMAPHQWLVKKRVERAKQLLEGNTLGLAEIALACGFVDQSHLSRVFTRSENCSPGKWRRLTLG
ncbi:helix-turn-helix domain-containing protein [Pseudomonas sp. NPDC087358]|uniref:helix-turn-helix domain-containing protein n=1 Tax=Pseudomonas sp. NPDC087358 TaxID=3364439 RepID=UPI00384B36E5